MEFGTVIAIGACLAAAGLSMVPAAFARPVEMGLRSTRALPRSAHHSQRADLRAIP